MKKLIFLAIIAVATLSSCSKGMECDCSGLTGDSKKYDKDMDKTEAEQDCAARSLAASASGGSCELVE